MSGKKQWIIKNKNEYVKKVHYREDVDFYKSNTIEESITENMLIGWVGFTDEKHEALKLYEGKESDMNLLDKFDNYLGYEVIEVANEEHSLQDKYKELTILHEAFNKRIDRARDSKEVIEIFKEFYIELDKFHDRYLYEEAAKDFAIKGRINYDI